MTDLLSLANGIRDDLGNHIEYTSKIENKIEIKYSKEAMEETEIPVLKEKLKETKEKADEMPTKIERNETEVSARMSRLEEKVAGMQNQLNDTTSRLNDTTSELLKMKVDLHTGQTAYDFEKNLAAYIYPPGTPITHGRIFTTLMNWLRTSKHTREGREGNRKWEKLKRECGWSNDGKQIAVFFKMLRCRREFAHPAVNFALPSPENFSNDEQECVQVIRNMTIKLNEQVNHHNI